MRDERHDRQQRAAEQHERAYSARRSRPPVGEHARRACSPTDSASSTTAIVFAQMTVEEPKNGAIRRCGGDLRPQRAHADREDERLQRQPQAPRRRLGTSAPSLHEACQR